MFMPSSLGFRSTHARERDRGLTMRTVLTLVLDATDILKVQACDRSTKSFGTGFGLSTMTSPELKPHA